VSTGAPPHEGPVLFFDGVCNLCNASVDRLMRIDRRRRLRFASLQGPTAQRLLAGTAVAHGAEEPDSLVLLDQGRVFVRSTAALRALVRVGGGWRLAAALLLVPRPLRDAVYRWVARHRYRWFGRRETCRLPTPDEAERLLD